jgi:hypothetical protein
MKKIFALTLMMLFFVVANAQSNAVAKFIIVEIIDEDENPTSAIYVQYNEKKTLIETIHGNASIVDKSEFYLGVPKTAISACGGWWAGAGDYYYIIPSVTGVALYHGWQDEEQEDEGFHWELLKELN